MFEIQEHYSPQQIQRNPHRVFVFGDNDLRIGRGGQARACRGFPNTVGIRTKKKPDVTPGSFYTDEEFEENCAKILEDVSVVRALLDNPNKIVVFPKSGIGTGRALLKEKAPKTFEFLCAELKKLGFENA